MDTTTGSTSISPSFKNVDEKIILEDLMNIFEAYSKKRKLCIAFDEFQEVAKYTNETFEKRLRSFIQRHSDICYIFAGSQRHLLSEMFNSQGRAFYKQADSFPLTHIGTKHYIPWIQNLFKKKKVTIQSKYIKTFIKRFENHPMYIQLFCFHLWEEVPDNELSFELIDKIEQRLIDRKDLECTALWEVLTINQKKTLKLIIINEGKNLYSADSLKQVDLKTASLVTKSLSSLVNREIVVKNSKYVIQDILFRKWLEANIF
ncbi:MAG: AAA family ATPase [Desulfobacterales bacterium]|nr:AAA family ATPase [Desulfobacterales bacterium]